MKRALLIAYLAAVHVVALVGVGRTSMAEGWAARFGIEHPSPRKAIENTRTNQAVLDAQAPAGASIFLGDSITAWFAVGTVAPAAVNLGISGQRSDQLLAGMDAYHSLARAGRVYLMIGTNDLLQHREQGLGERYAQILAKVPAGVPVVLSSVPPLARQDVRAAVDAARVACAADRRCTFVDVFSALSSGGKPLPGVLADGVHPTAAGYALWAEQLRAALSPEKAV